jgi:inosine/xanthosine triphosphate pyrophosphatase family protein
LGDYLQKPVIADDSGISVLGLAGFPGVFSKR